MSVWNLSSVSGNLKSVSHTDINGDVFLLATRPKNAKALWSYVYPGNVLRYFQGCAFNFVCELFHLGL